MRVTPAEGAGLTEPRVGMVKTLEGAHPDFGDHFERTMPAAEGTRVLCSSRYDYRLRLRCSKQVLNLVHRNGFD